MTFDCPNCRTTLSAEDHQGGKRVRCPTCLKAITVPMAVLEEIEDAEDIETALVGSAKAPAPPIPTPAPTSTLASTPERRAPVSPTPTPTPTSRTEVPVAPAPTPQAPPPPLPRPAGRSYGFNCPLCSSRLAASESQGGTEGDCPTCGQRITIPILDRMGRLIDPRTKEIIKPDPHPVHAYAAAGSRAPEIRRTTTGSHAIVCPRCQATNAITANACKSCGCPFTMEGTQESVGESPPLATASLILGIASLVGFCLYVPGPLAVILGGTFLYQAPDSPGKGQALAGIILGSLGTLATLWWHFFR